MTQETGTSRPMHLSDAQVTELAAGKSTVVGEHSRPRAVTAAHVEALRKGDEVHLENIPVLERIASSDNTVVSLTSESMTSESSPLTLTDKDVQELHEGKDIGLEKREPLK